MANRRSPQHPSPTLFQAALERNKQLSDTTPLADRLRPRTLSEIAGQPHLLGPGKLLAQTIAHDRIPSMILWGPPGCGKTTLARVVAQSTQARFIPYSAVSGSVPELRGLLQEATDSRAYQGQRTILFIDEIHRFHKGQQDALLPTVEQGHITLIGATTENPSFAINAALLSRCRVFVLQALSKEDLIPLFQRALSDNQRGLGQLQITADQDALDAIASLASGDARRALGTLELSVLYARSLEPPVSHLTRAHVEAASAHRPLLYDRDGEEHYNVVSALIKSLRGSDPDAALYWMFRMLEAGDDPLFVSRRLIIFASEDIGNASPQALQIAIAADAAFRRMGMPEGAYPLAHACLYLACAPKSDGVKRAIKSARELIQRHGPLPVPKKLRNAPTRLMKDEGYGSGYRYAHDYDEHVVPGETYLPDELVGSRVYEPTDQGQEQAIQDRLSRLRKSLERSSETLFHPHPQTPPPASGEGLPIRKFPSETGSPFSLNRGKRGWGIGGDGVSSLRARGLRSS